MSDEPAAKKACPTGNKDRFHSTRSQDFVSG
jgi:hypothetical protein